MNSNINRMKNFMGKLQEEKKRRHINVKPIIESYIDKGKEYNYNKIDVENYFFEKTQTELFNNDYKNLEEIHKELREYLAFFEEDLKNEHRSKLWGKEYLEEKIQELRTFEKQLKDFATEKKIILNSNPESKIDFLNQGDIKSIQNNLEQIEIEKKVETEHKEIYLTKDIELDRKTALLKTLLILERKLESIETIIGDEKIESDIAMEETFKEEDHDEKINPNLEKFEEKNENDLLSIFNKEKTNLKLLSLFHIKENNKKLKIVGDELERVAKDRKMNYFQAPQKMILKEFLVSFDQKINAEDKLNLNPAEIYKKFSKEAEFLDQVSSNLYTFQICDKILKKGMQENSEHKEILENLENSLKKNLEILEKNKNINK